jgi:hypothetical protein
VGKKLIKSDPAQYRCISGHRLRLGFLASSTGAQWSVGLIKLVKGVWADECVRSILIMQQLPPAQKVKAADDADVYLHDKCLFFVFFAALGCFMSM